MIKKLYFILCMKLALETGLDGRFATLALPRFLALLSKKGK